MALQWPFRKSPQRRRDASFPASGCVAPALLHFAASLVLIFVPLPRPILAQGSTATPAVVTKGFKAYEKDGARAALEAWLENSPVSGDSALRRGVLDALYGVESRFGKMEGYEILGAAALGAYVLRTYTVIRYARGPLYAFFDCYRTDSGWVIVNFLVNSQLSAVLPWSMLVPKLDSTLRLTPR